MGAHCFKGSRSSSRAVTANTAQNDEEDVPYSPRVHPLPSNMGKMTVSDIRHTCAIDTHVRNTLKGVNNLHEIPTREPPLCMMRLHDVAEVENGWLAVVCALVECVAIDEPVGTAVIMLVIDDCSLPNKTAITRIVKLLGVCSKPASKLNAQAGKWRNACTMFGCVADKLAGPNAESLLSQDVIDFLLSCLEPRVNLEVTLHALVAIEKLAKTQSNKRVFEKLSIANQLMRFEQLLTRLDNNFLQQQVGFCAQWLLDNIFVKPGRQFTYEAVLKRQQQQQSNESEDGAASRAAPPAMLNDDDVSEYLKISADGLTARCDAYSFESVRSTVHVDSGSWYYEVTIITSGIMQVGWASKNSRFNNHEGFGIGDDEFSCAYDGCRQFIWHNAITTRHSHPPWKPGDVVGFLIDIEHEELVFSLNGQTLPPEKQIFTFIKSGFFAAASFMSFQQCIFNFGATPFQYPPSHRAFKPLNEAAAGIAWHEQCILPRHVKQSKMLDELNNIDKDACFICFSLPADTQLLPCQHTGVCMRCAMQLEFCSVCRSPIEQRTQLT